MITRKHFGRGAWRTKLSGLRTTGKRTTLLMVPLLTVLSLILVAIPAPKVSAAAPTFKWVDNQTVQISGGTIKGSFKIVNGSAECDGMVFCGQVDVTTTNNCKVNVSIGVPEGTGGKTADYSKTLVWTSMQLKDGGTACKGNELDLGGLQSGGTSTIGNLGARSNEGEPATPTQEDDPEDKQVVEVSMTPGWTSTYTVANPSSPPKASEMIPAEDLWTLCGNAADPKNSYDDYAKNAGQVPDYAQMEKDCLNRKSGWEIDSKRAAYTSSGSIKYANKFTGVAAGNYVVCDFIANDCQAFQKIAGTIKKINWDQGDPTAKVPDASTDADSADNEPEVACDVTFDLTTIFSLKWLVCPIVNTATFAVGKLEDVINSILTVDVQDIFNDTDASNAYHKAWNSFRVFALGLIVIAALVMVVSQAAGVEILDAYTVRKVLPRLLFAAIFIALSWDILEFLCQLSNDAGKGIRTLIYAPFQALNKNNELGGGSSVVLTMLGTGAALGFGWVGLLSFALTGLLAAFVAFAVLVLRKMLILLLVMMAPFAIACYILPNTQKGWTIWKDGLMSALLVFPIISAFIAIGRVFAITSFNAPGVQVVNQLIGFIAYFAPYFLISLAFRMAGGFMATIGGFANDKSRGAFDRLKNFRGNKLKENMHDMGTGHRFQDNNPFARNFNKVTGGVGTFGKSNSKWGMLTNKDVRRNVFAQQRSLNAMEYAGTNRAKVASENDPLLRAQTYMNEADARRNMAKDWNLSDSDTFGTVQQQIDNAVAAAKANGGFGTNQQINAARRLFSTGTGYDDLKQVHQTVARVAGGNDDVASDILGFGNAESGGKGRLGLKVGYGKQMELYQSAKNGTLSDEQLDKATIDAVKGNDVLSVLRGKPIDVKNVTGAMSRQLARESNVAQGPAQTAEQIKRKEDAQKEAGTLAGIVEQYQQNGAYASPTNVKNVDELVVQPTINIRNDIQQQASDVMLQRNPRTGAMEPMMVGEVDRHNNPVINPQTGQQNQVPILNSNQNQNVAQGYSQQKPRGMYDAEEMRRRTNAP
jgi:hypothetical protein